MNATQETLNGLTLETELREAVGYVRKEEADVRARAGLYGGGITYTVVDAATIEALGAKLSKGAPRFLTVEAARAVLPAGYSPLTRDGTTWPAAKAVPTVTVSGYAAAEVEAMRGALAELRAEKAEAAAAVKAATAKRRKAWLMGEPGAMLSYDDMICAEDVRDSVRQAPRAVIGATTIGREYPVSAVSAPVRGDGTEVFDAGRGEWVRDE